MKSTTIDKKMAANYRITQDVVLIVLRGTVTDAELITAQQMMFGDPSFTPHVIDALGITDMRATADAIRRLARNACDQGMRRAAVLADSDVVYGLARMYAGYAYEAEVQVHRSAADAVSWLTST